MSSPVRSYWKFIWDKDRKSWAREILFHSVHLIASNLTKFGTFQPNIFIFWLGVIHKMYLTQCSLHDVCNLYTTKHNAIILNSYIEIQPLYWGMFDLLIVHVKRILYQPAVLGQDSSSVHLFIIWYKHCFLSWSTQ